MNTGRKPPYRFGPFRLDVQEHRLLAGDRAVPLTPKVFDVLRALVERSGHLVEKDALLKEVWPDAVVEEGALNRSISVLRKALAEHDPGGKYIETVPKRGYRFVAAVRGCGDEQATAPDERPPVLTAEQPVRVRGRRRLAVAAGVGVVVGAVWWLALLRPAIGDQPERVLKAAAHRQVTFTGSEGAPTVSPDGRRIAYISSGPEKRLVVQELAGGPPLEIFAAAEIGHLRWSPDGTQMLLWTRGAGRHGVHVLPQLGGTPRAISAGQYTACWSPDGAVIAVAEILVGKIRLFDGLGREQRTLTLHGDHWAIWDLDWTANGDRLLYTSSDRQGRYTISTIRADGSNQQQLLSVGAEIRSVRWAPAGDAIYYFQRVNQTTSLHRMPARAEALAAEGSNTALLTGLETDGFFALSADARRLVYARAPYHSNLRMLDSATGRTVALTQGTSLIERPRISPDGRSVVFNVGHEPQANLYTMPLDGDTPKQLTFLGALSVGGAWSSDGSRIAFGSTQGGQPRIWTIPSGGGTPRLLPAVDVSDNLDVVWSPGSRILYQRAGNGNYSEIDPQTAVERLLVEEGSRGWMFAPLYSPDSRRVAVFWNRPPDRGIWVIDGRTTDRRHLLVRRSSASSLMPIGWSADGAWIYVVEGSAGGARGATSFVSGTLTDATILRVASKGGAAETVSAIPFAEIGGVSMTPDGRRFVFPVFSSRSDIWIVDDFDPRAPR
jgi:Tol biopolymer transport system component/DNA-binding winged helix-turn-helix (wHTH) protein